MEIVNIKTDKLIPYVNNPRHNEDAVEKVMASIQEFGFKVPLVIDKNNVVVTGHTRLKAAKRLGIDEVPCVVADDLSDAQIKAFRIADNKVSEYAEWDEEALQVELEQLEELDFDLDSLSIDFSDFDLNIGEDVSCETMEEDDVELEPVAIPFSRQKDIWHLGVHTVMCGSSTEPMDVDLLMGDTMADLMVTDPPYNVSYEGKTKDALTIQNDRMSNDNFYEFLYDFYRNAYEHMNDGAGLYVFHADSEGMNFRKAMVDSGFKLAQCCIWVKNCMVMGRQDYHWQHEPCLYGWKPTGPHRWFTDRKQTTTWFFDRPTKNLEHPTMKPIDLIKYPIENSSQKGDVVLDLFGGSGSTLIACEETNRVNYSMELDEKYVDVIVRRYIRHKGNADDVYLTRDGKTIPFSEIEGDFEL